MFCVVLVISLLRLLVCWGLRLVMVVLGLEFAVLVVMGIFVGICYVIVLVYLLFLLEFVCDCRIIRSCFVSWLIVNLAMCLILTVLLGLLLFVFIRCVCVYCRLLCLRDDCCLVYYRCVWVLVFIVCVLIVLF